MSLSVHKTITMNTKGWESFGTTSASTPLPLAIQNYQFLQCYGLLSLVWKNVSDPQSPDVSFIKHLWDEMEHIEQLACPTSVPKLIVAVQTERAQLPTEIPSSGGKPFKKSGIC